jgi:hypothetical protein
MLLRYIPLLLLIVSAAGCTTTTPLKVNANEGDELTGLSEEFRGEGISVVLTDGRVFPAIGLHLAPDSTSWFDPAGELVVVETTEIASIRRVDRDRGRLQGAGLGTLMGMALGGTFMLRSFKNQDMIVGAHLAFGAGALMGAIPGLILGASVGERQGAQEVHEIEWE